VIGVDAKETVEQIAQGAYPAFALLAGMQRELFTPLAEGPRSAGELAELLSVDAERLQTLLYALVAAGLLEVAEGRFANGVEAERLLVRGRSGYIGERHWIWSRFYAAALHSAESVRQGGPAVPIDFADQDEGELEPLLRGLHPGPKPSARSSWRGSILPRGPKCWMWAAGRAGWLLGWLRQDPISRRRWRNCPGSLA
jgi:hypothetical protein